MSWRLIILFVVLALGASLWGGYVAGDWLIANGPLRSPTMITAEEEANALPVLDANGKPYVGAPAQPLVNGRLGFLTPKNERELADWHIESKPADHYNPPIALARQRLNSNQLAQLSQGSAVSPSGLQGIANVDLEGGRRHSGSNEAIQPVEVNLPPAPAEEQRAAPSDPDWQAKLQRALHACSEKGFFDRPSCAWEARNQYCGPNNAWGKVAGCPSKSF